MPTRDSAWPAGTPNWVDCSFDHLRQAGDFYGKLFGWEIRDGGEQFGHYAVALKHGHAAAGLAPRMQPDVPSLWCTFIASDDVDATTRLVAEAGGRVLVEPMDVPGTGRMAFYQDTQGAAFGAWQGGEHHGFGIVDEPGSIGWTHLTTRDLDGAKAFYSQVFGYTYDERGEGYVTCHRPGDGAVVAGMGAGSQHPDGDDAGWLTHFVVADRDSCVATVEELDGEVLLSFDIPLGPAAIVRGPEGETFAVVAFTEQVQDEAAPSS